MFPLKQALEVSTTFKIQEYRVEVTEYCIVDYRNTSPRKHKCQSFTHLKTFSKGGEGGGRGDIATTRPSVVISKQIYSKISPWDFPPPISTLCFQSVVYCTREGCCRNHVRLCLSHMLFVLYSKIIVPVQFGRLHMFLEHPTQRWRYRCTESWAHFLKDHLAMT